MMELSLAVLLATVVTGACLAQVITFDQFFLRVAQQNMGPHKLTAEERPAPEPSFSARGLRPAKTLTEDGPESCGQAGSRADSSVPRSSGWWSCRATYVAHFSRSGRRRLNTSDRAYAASILLGTTCVGSATAPTAHGRSAPPPSPGTTRPDRGPGLRSRETGASSEASSTRSASRSASGTPADSRRPEPFGIKDLHRSTAERNPVLALRLHTLRRHRCHAAGHVQEGRRHYGEAGAPRLGIRHLPDSSQTTQMTAAIEFGCSAISRPRAGSL